MSNKEEILSVRNLSISFRQYGKGFRQTELPAIKNLNVTVHQNELVAVVGSSGSGKSLLAHGVMGLLPYNAAMKGDVSFLGTPLTARRQKQLRGREIVLVPQNVSYLNPLLTIGSQVRKGSRDEEVKERARGVLARYGLGADVERQYPFELSGGMTRRVLISTAVMESPKLVIADEPTPGLHEKIARRVLGHFRELADDGAGVLLITHDLELALEVADRVVVFYAGTTIEDAAASDFKQLETLRHPYTKALWRAMPEHGFQYITGTQPYAGTVHSGCPFRPRCEQAEARCETETIPWQRQRDGYVLCCKGVEA